MELFQQAKSFEPWDFARYVDGNFGSPREYVVQVIAKADYDNYLVRIEGEEVQFRAHISSLSPA